jgi:MscS family membrane protein
MNLRMLRSAGLALALSLLCAAASAQPEPTAKQLLSKEESPAAEPSQEADTPQTPRGAVRAYLEAARAGDYERAARYLDVPRGQDGPALARELHVVLDRTLWVDFDLLSAAPEGDQDDGLPAGRDRLGEIPSEHGSVPVLLTRAPAPGAEPGAPPIWRFARSTLARVPALYEQYGYGRLGELLPGFFFELRLLDVQLWQWIGLMVLVVAAGFLSWALAALGFLALRPALRSGGELARGLAEVAGGPLRLLLAVLLFSAGRHLLGLAVPVNVALAALESALVVVAVTWILLRAVDVLGSVVEHRLRRQQQQTALTLVPPGRKAVKVFVIAVAVLATLDSFGFDVTAVLAGLGIGGIAVALAAQKTVENLFGGVTLYADRPVAVGDFCRFGDGANDIGTVEEIGLRSTRVRTLGRTVVTLPNAEFANRGLENFTARDRIFYHPILGLRYETTPEQLRFILVRIRELLYAHPKVNPEPARVRFINFGAYSLDLEVFAYVDVTDYSEFLGVAEDLNLRIMDIVAEAGSGFAFPSQTTYLEQGEGLDRERAAQVAKEVARWREQNALYLPRFPEQRIEELSSSLEYPPPGAPRNGGGRPRS